MLKYPVSISIHVNISKAIWQKDNLEKWLPSRACGLQSMGFWLGLQT